MIRTYNKGRGSVGNACRYLYHSDHVEFWDGLSTGSDRKRLIEAAHTGNMWVPHTGQWVKANPRLLAALVELEKACRANHGTLVITALTGGEHMVGSQHYVQKAFDLGLGTPLNRESINHVLARHDGSLNSEDLGPGATHHHADVP